MVADRILGNTKSPIISSSARKNTVTHKAVSGLMDNATNTGGTAIMKKPIFGISIAKKVIAPHTHAPRNIHDAEKNSNTYRLNTAAN